MYHQAQKCIITSLLFLLFHFSLLPTSRACLAEVYVAHATGVDDPSHGINNNY